MKRFNRIHAICERLRKKPCLLCPAWEAFEGHGRCQRGCYGLAQELSDIAVHGNPWGKRGLRKHIQSWRKRFNQPWRKRFNRD
jgi:hypothetical protein